MADIARLVAALELESSKFHKEIDRVNNTLGRLEKNAKRKLGSIESAFKQLAVGAAIIQGLRSLAGGLKSVIDEADKLGDVSKQIGLSVEAISELTGVAEKFGVEAGELQGSLAKLNSTIVGAAAGNKKAEEGFRLLGLSAKDAQGNAKPLETVINEVANAIQRLPEGSGLAQRALEKLTGSANLAPFFRQGAAAIADAREEIKRFGGSISTDFANKADDLNDSLVNLKSSFRSIGRDLASYVIPRLEKFAQVASDIISTQRFLGSEKGIAFQIRETREELARLDKEKGLDAIKTKLNVQLAELIQRQSDLRGPIQLVNEELKKQGEAASEAADRERKLIKAEQDRINQEKLKGERDKAAAEAQRVREAQVQVATNLAKQQADIETDILERANKSNLISFANYYNKRAQIQRNAIDAEIAQQERLLGTGIDASERVQILGQIEVLKRQRDAITNQAVASIAESEREIADSLRDIRAELLEAQGDEVGAATIRLQAQYEDLLERLKAESNTAGIEIVNALFNERLVGEQLSKIQSDYSEFSSRLSAQQDVIQAQQETGLLSERQARKEIIKLQKAALPELQKLIEAQRLLALETANPAAHNALLQLEADYIRLANVGNETALQIKDAFESGVIAALQEVAPTIETGIKAFDKFANTVIQRINDIAAEITAQALGDLLFGFLGSAGGGSGVGGAISAGFLPSLIPRAGGGPVYAGGGYVVGEDGPELFSPSSNGRIIPNDELGMGRSVVVNINVSAPNGRLSQESIDQVATRGGLAVRRAMARNS